MQAAIAMAVGVYVIMDCFAQAIAASPDPVLNANWMAAHQAGVKAYGNNAWSEALASFRKCWELSDTPLARGLASGDVANALHELGREAEARKWFELSLEILRSQPGRDDDRARASLGLADVERGLGDFRAAEQTLRSAIPLHGSAELQAAVRNRLGDGLREQGREEEARRLLLEALAFSGNAPKEQMYSLLTLAQLDRETMRWSESISFSNRALGLARRRRDTEGEALALRNLGLVELNRGEMALGAPLLRRSLALLEMSRDTPPEQIANALQCVAMMYFDLHKYTAAETTLLDALAQVKKDVGPEHPHCAMVMEQLAEADGARKHYAEAQQYADRAYSIMVRVYGADSYAAAEALTTRGYVKQGRRDLNGAASDYETATRILQNGEAANAQGLVLAMSRYASVLRALHRKNEAKELDARIQTFRLR